jgi:hypothetical protein
MNAAENTIVNPMLNKAGEQPNLLNNNIVDKEHSIPK